ncbi:hypothetical protein EJB05_41390, partial [Eragrostis curvula]
MAPRGPAAAVFRRRRAAKGVGPQRLRVSAASVHGAHAETAWSSALENSPANPTAAPAIKPPADSGGDPPTTTTNGDLPRAQPVALASQGGITIYFLLGPVMDSSYFRVTE